MSERVCPVWMGYFLASPLRKIYQNPIRILSPYLKSGMKIIDIGSAMGFFSIPAAKIVGKSGKVICIDLQVKMLEQLKTRALKAKVLDRIEIHHCSPNSLEIDALRDQIDLALAFAVLHEMPDLSNIFKEINTALKEKAKLLIAEPSGHVTEQSFQTTLEIAKKNGFIIIDHPKINGSKTAVLEKIA